MKNFFKGIKLASVLALTLAFVGCDDDDVQLPEITAGFTQTIDQNDGVVDFINTSSNADTYTWDFGDGTTSTLINPVKVYATGTYTVTLTATNVAGASDTFEDTISIQIPEEVSFPITFDNSLVDYGVTTFNGVTFQVVENPDPSGANPNVSNVGEIVNSGAAFEGFFFELGEPLNLATDKTVKVLFWSSTPIDVLLKLEQGTSGDIEVVASHGGTGWEELYFSFTSDASYSQITFFVDGPGATSGTFYIDEITQINTADVPCQETDLDLPIDFDCDSIDYATKIVGDVSFTVIDNPQMSGINNVATKVGQITNTGGNFDNAFFNLDVPIDFSSDNGVRLKLYSEVALPILLKFEDGTAANVEDLQNHSGTGWEELLFTLNSTGSYNDMVLFVAFNQNDTGTFYVDDIEQVTGMAPPPPFDDGLLDNGDFQTVDTNGNVTEWIQGVDDTNPAPTITMGSNRYYSIDITTATPGSPFNINVSQKVPITQGETYELSFEAWTDATTASRTIIAGIGLSSGTFANDSQVVTINSTPTVYNLTLSAAGFGAPDARVLFDLADEVGQVNIDNVSLFLEGTGGGGGTGGGCSATPVPATSLPVNFETCESFTSTFSSIGDGGVVSALTANPNASGINASANVLQVTKASGINRWGGVQNSFPSGTIDITTNTFKIKVYSSIPDVTYRFELALDPQTTPVTGNPAPVFRQVTGGANTWVELEFTFTNLPASPTTYNQLVIKPDNPDGSDGETTTEERIFYFDDLRLD